MNYVINYQCLFIFKLLQIKLSAPFSEKELILCTFVFQEARIHSEEFVQEANGHPCLEATNQEQNRVGLGGGPGFYKVVKTGPSGHNIRSCPNLRGIPIGMLVLGNKVKAVGEVWTPENKIYYCGCKIKTIIFTKQFFFALLGVSKVTVVSLSFNFLSWEN